MALLKFSPKTTKCTVGGVEYQAVRIGKLYWTTENLRLATTNSQWYKNSTDYDYAHYPMLGRYYDPRDAQEIKSALPDKWRLPTLADFNDLKESLGDTNEERCIAAFAKDDFKISNATNSSGISLYSCARAQANGSIWDKLTWCYLWGDMSSANSSLEGDMLSAGDSSGWYFGASHYQFTGNYIYRHPIRIVKDA